MFLGWPFSKIVAKILIRPYKMNLVHGGLLHYMDMKKFLKNLRLRNRWSNFEIISQECSFSGSIQKFWSVHKHGSCEWGLLALYVHEENLQKSSPKPLVRFWNNFTGMFLAWPFSKIFCKIWSLHKLGSGEWGLFALYGHEEILKKSCSPKPQVQFWNNFTGMFLWWPFSKIVWKILIRP